MIVVRDHAVIFSTLIYQTCKQLFLLGFRSVRTIQELQDASLLICYFDNKTTSYNARCWSFLLFSLDPTSP